MCFGGGRSKPQVVSTGTQQITDKSWETLEPYIKNVLESSRSRFEDQLAEGYQPMPGGYEARYEGPSAEELAAREGMLQQGLSGIAGTGMASARPYYESGLSALSSSMGEFGPQQAQQYMNPYQQAVVDVAKREAVRSAQPTFRSIGDRAEASGAFGGSRQAIAEAEANRNLQQQLGDIQTTGRQQAYGQGRAAFEAQKAREAAGAARLFGQAPQAWQQGIREMGAVEEVGRARRGDEQAKKDFLYEQFEAEKMFPSTAYGEHLAHVRGFPYQPSRYETTTNMQPRPGLGRQLLGTGMGLASMAGKLGWSPFGASGGQVEQLESGGQVQGGLSGLVQRHQNNAAIDYDSLDEYQQQLYDIGGSPYMATETETATVREQPASTTPDTLQSILMDRIRKGRQVNLSPVKDALARAAEARKATYSPEWRAKEQARIDDMRSQAAWDQLGKVGASMMSAPGHMDILQSLGHSVKETGAIDKLGEVREKQLAAQKELDKRGMLDADAEVKESLQLANIEMKEQELLNAEVKNLVALAKAKGVDLKELERFAKIVGGPSGAVGSADALRAIKKMNDLLKKGTPVQKAAQIALKEIKNQGANVVKNPPLSGSARTGRGKGTTKSAIDSLQTQQ